MEIGLLIIAGLIFLGVKIAQDEEKKDGSPAGCRGLLLLLFVAVAFVTVAGLASEHASNTGIVQLQPMPSITDGPGIDAWWDHFIGAQP